MRCIAYGAVLVLWGTQAEDESSKKVFLNLKGNGLGAKGRQVNLLLGWVRT
ncbi:hypothetical protein KIS4809_1863 [Bacillus sp. ZZV12-4809]|nr:hypothetical protein KIS4809_1863 [Bacillus sp. ZZV12-4809]